MLPHRFQQCLAAQHAGGREHFRERAVGELNVTCFVQHQHTFNHAVEQGILPGAGFRGSGAILLRG